MIQYEEEMSHSEKRKEAHENSESLSTLEVGEDCKEKISYAEEKSSGVLPAGRS